MRCHLLTVLATLAATVVADVKFTAPASGGSFKGGSVMTITWTDDGETPTIDQFSTYTLNLMAGGSTSGSFKSVYTISNAAYSGTTGTVTFTVPVSAGTSSTLGYFLQMISVGVDGGQDIVYSSRFGLTGMSGTLTAAQTNGIAAVTAADDIPDDVHGLAAAAATGATAALAAGDEPWTVPYHLQTGLVKYAPPQPLPGTKITAKTPSMMNPSTSYTIFSTYAKPATITYTSTASQTYTASSRENTAAAADQPTAAAMNKFLNRWKD